MNVFMDTECGISSISVSWISTCHLFYTQRFPLDLQWICLFCLFVFWKSNPRFSHNEWVAAANKMLLTASISVSWTNGIECTNSIFKTTICVSIYKSMMLDVSSFQSNKFVWCQLIFVDSSSGLVFVVIFRWKFIVLIVSFIHFPIVLIFEHTKWQRL